ncbi:MAG: protein-arginine deiminase family protein [Kofleriaceae bacterium]
MSRLYALLLCPWLAGACGPDAGTGPNGDNPDGGMPGDDACTGDGCTMPPDDAPPAPTWTFGDVNGVANTDDDDGSQNDWNQAPFATDDDFSTLTLPAATLALVPSGGSVQLSLAGDVANVRVFDGTMHVLGAERGTATHSFTPSGGDKVFTVEFGAYLAKAELTLVAKDASGGTSATTTIDLQAAPLVINHHLQPAEALWAVTSNGNASMIQTYQQILGNKFTAVSGSSVAGDVWIQDEFEFSTMMGEGGQRVDVVIDSIRNRGLQNMSSSWIRPDEYTQTWGNPQLATSYDSFGNLEATPPFTVGGVSYPFGKIYYGRVGSSGMNTTLGNFLASQKVQAPFQIPTNWLCVGHVDEFISFVPAPGSAKGWKLVIADTTSAYNLLATLTPSSPLSRYGQDHGYPSVASLIGDTALRALNQDLQTDYIEPAVAKFKTELGLTDADIIRVPSLFEQPSGCGGRVAALIPGMANLIVANVDGTTTHLFTADPFFRGSGVSQASDPVIAAFQAAMPAGMSMHFLDDWNTYHMGLGEVHCGTNVRRTPTAMWWSTAMHLMGGN